MARSAFPYIGGKTNMADWIIRHMPDHDVYIEPFGGSGSVLLNKRRSNQEIFNDLDGDIVNFFNVAREKKEELSEWVKKTPYSRELHSEWAENFYSGYRSEDDVERAGRFLFLRYSQFGAKCNGKSGFRRGVTSSATPPAKTWAGIEERVDMICERMRGVLIENKDFAELIEDHDSPDTLFYLDPPYVDKDGTYRVDDFEHEDLHDTLDGIEAYAMVSYTKLPGGLYEDWNVVRKDVLHKAGARKGEDPKEAKERLLLNFDPEDVRLFVNGQTEEAGEW